MGLGHREQPKISEEGIWPSSVIAKAVTLTRTMKLSAQDRSQTATNEAVDGRERESMGMPEITEPTSQEWIERRDYHQLRSCGQLRQGLSPRKWHAITGVH